MVFVGIQMHCVYGVKPVVGISEKTIECGCIGIEPAVVVGELGLEGQ